MQNHEIVKGTRVPFKDREFNSSFMHYMSGLKKFN